MQLLVSIFLFLLTSGSAFASSELRDLNCNLSNFTKIRAIPGTKPLKVTAQLGFFYKDFAVTIEEDTVGDTSILHLVSSTGDEYFLYLPVDRKSRQSQSLEGHMGARDPMVPQNIRLVATATCNLTFY